ncbi:MAG TPA: tripartite tricarboxylate transporter TctB family protein [Casimicrobiaceae bacterium]|nr:tripartite tricarboxylate transporter TctB family protein [Casimicrobiaceae bacterium]
MDHPSTDEAAATGGLETRWVELVFAVLLFIGGSVVVWDSSRIGAQWGSDGPQAGYFPWLTGSALLLSGLWIAAITLFRWKRLEGDVFVSWARLKPVLAMLLPTIAYVVLIHLLGIYVASAIYIGAFMIWQGKYRGINAAIVAIAVPIVVFCLFELWFRVPLPKGPLERMLGY